MNETLWPILWSNFIVGLNLEPKVCRVSSSFRYRDFYAKKFYIWKMMVFSKEDFLPFLGTAFLRTHKRMNQGDFALADWKIPLFLQKWWIKPYVPKFMWAHMWCCNYEEDFGQIHVLQNKTRRLCCFQNLWYVILVLLTIIASFILFFLRFTFDP